MNQELQTYIESIQSDAPTIASVMSREIFFEMISTVFGSEIYSWEDLQNIGLHQVLHYGIEEWKKEFSIQTVKTIIEALALKPYSGKNFFVLEDFDLASISAQNATLKMLEDCPPYAVIILVVNNPQKLLPTIISRTVSFFTENTEYLSEDINVLLDKFLSGDTDGWISYLYNNNFEKTTAKNILIKVFPHLDFSGQKECQKIILALENTYESPKNLLEIFFLSQDFF